MKATPTPLPDVNFSDQGDVRYLHLGTEWVQGSMLLDQPFDIEADGEVLGTTPATFEIIPGAIQLKI